MTFSHIFSIIDLVTEAIDVVLLYHFLNLDAIDLFYILNSAISLNLTELSSTISDLSWISPIGASNLTALSLFDSFIRLMS